MQKLISLPFSSSRNDLILMEDNKQIHADYSAKSRKENEKLLNESIATRKQHVAQDGGWLLLQYSKAHDSLKKMTKNACGDQTRSLLHKLWFKTLIRPFIRSIFPSSPRKRP